MPSRRIIGQAIEAGVIRDVDDIVDVGLETIRHRLESHLSLRTALDAERWAEELHAWVHGHSASTPLVSDEAISRDSI